MVCQPHLPEAWLSLHLERQLKIQLELTPVVEYTNSEPPNTARVQFDITVLVYVSNQLQVSLVWGEFDTTAAWNTDEDWTATVDFPFNTSNQLIVTFSDGNGAFILCSFETSFGTSENLTESFRITADDFDTTKC